LPELKRTLGLFDASAIGIGAIIGGGIFVVTGLAAGRAGPGLLFSLLISAVVAFFTALSFSEIAAQRPREGGGYDYAHELVSPLAGFVAGWLWLVSNVVVGVAVSIGFASYFSALVNLPVRLIAPIACIGVTVVNSLGTRGSATMNNGLVLVKLSILVFFVVFGLFGVKSTNFSPLFPNGPAGVMQASAIIFFAFSGFARITILSEEVKDPERNVPRAIMIALAVSTVVYLLVGYVAVGLAGYHELANSGSPLADAAAIESKGAANIVSLGALAATLSVLLTTLLGLSRVSYSMARNHDLPGFFGIIRGGRGVPLNSVIVLGLAMALMAAFTDLMKAVAISNFAALIYYSLGNYAAFRLEKPKYPKIVPVVGLASCIVLLLFLSSDAWMIGIGALCIGLVYYYFGRNRFEGLRKDKG
jgi:APA family basic amino acid/polyamine antiporter